VYRANAFLVSAQVQLLLRAGLQEVLGTLDGLHAE
jgi:hypothetical protein